MRNGLPYILAAKISFYLINAKLFTNIFLTMNILSKNNSYRDRRATDTRFYQIIRKTADFQRYTRFQTRDTINVKRRMQHLKRRSEICITVDNS